MVEENEDKKERGGILIPNEAGRGGIETEFSIHTEPADLPLTDCPSYMKGSLAGVCVSGTATIVVFNTKFYIRPDMIVFLVPWQLVSIKEVSDDFRFTFYKASEDMFTDTLSAMWRLTPDFFFHMSKHIASEAVEGNIRRFLNYCDLLAYRVEFAPEICRRESVMQLLRVSYWDRYALYISNPDVYISKFNYTRKEELAYRFLHLILEDHSPSKDVAYYAGKLDVSPKYLTNLIRTISGRSARDWIVYYTLLEIKSLLRESSMDLKLIAIRTNFPDQSTLSRFFRHYTGITPSKYRKNVFF